MHSVSRPIPFLAVLSAALLLGLAAPAMAEDTGPQRLLTVTGEGHAEAKPDLAYVSLGVTEGAETADKALAAMSRAGTQVLGFLAAAGVAESDIQTGQLSLDPMYSESSVGGQMEVTGFVASTMYEVRVRDLSKLGAVLDAVTAEGANRLGGVRFDVVTPGPLLDAARTQAVQDARHAAEVLAAAAGATLGEIVRIDMTSGSYAPQPMIELRMAADSMSVPVAGGSVGRDATVTMVFVLAD